MIGCFYKLEKIPYSKTVFLRATTTSAAGHMGYSNQGNRVRCFKKIGIDAAEFVDIGIAHGGNVKTASVNDRGKILTGCDSVITSEPDVYLAVTTADCLPVSVIDPIRNNIGLVHAGWKGLQVGIIKNTVDKMSDLYKTRPKDLLIYIGPHICQRHYEVKSEVAELFRSELSTLFLARQRIFLDLAKTAENQLSNLGVRRENINVSPICTFEETGYFSYRKDQTSDRFLTVLGKIYRS